VAKYDGLPSFRIDELMKEEIPSNVNQATPPNELKLKEPANLNGEASMKSSIFSEPAANKVADSIPLDSVSSKKSNSAVNSSPKLKASPMKVVVPDHYAFKIMSPLNLHLNRKKMPAFISPSLFARSPESSASPLLRSLSSEKNATQTSTTTQSPYRRLRAKFCDHRDGPRYEQSLVKPVMTADVDARLHGHINIPSSFENPHSVVGETEGFEVPTEKTSVPDTQMLGKLPKIESDRGLKLGQHSEVIFTLRQGRLSKERKTPNDGSISLTEDELKQIVDREAATVIHDLNLKSGDLGD
jgi:hypothetical protein